MPVTELKNYFSDALIPAVRITRQIIATLLAAQMFIAFGLCGVVCCLSAQGAEPVQAVDSHSNHGQTVQPAETSSHCHAKAGKKASASNKTRVQAGNAAQHCHGGKLAGYSHPASAQICQCEANSQENPAFSVNQSDSTEKRVALTVLPAWQNADQSSPPPSASPPHLLPSSPPFGGYQLSLRI